MQLTPSVDTKQKIQSPTQESFRGLPTRIKIESLNIDAAIEYMGKGPEGEMASPNGAANVGWYKYGAIPGDEGTATLAGHVVGAKGEPGVFKSLSKLKAGDTFSVVDAKGQSAFFIVRQIKSYAHDQEPTEVFNSSEGIHLNLITCIGAWNKTEKNYAERLVIFSEKII